MAIKRIPLSSPAYIVKTVISGALLKDYIEERAMEIGEYIIDKKATVRQTAKRFGVSKSTVHKDRCVIIRIVKGDIDKP